MWEWFSLPPRSPTERAVRGMVKVWVPLPVPVRLWAVPANASASESAIEIVVADRRIA